MKQIILMIAVVALAGQPVLAADKKPLIADPIVEKAIRVTLLQQGNAEGAAVRINS